MKGWIKVHEVGSEVAIPVRAIQTVQVSEHDRFHGFIQTNAVGNIYFEETYDEVLALIEEAESGKEKTTPVAVVEADKLLEWLNDVKEEAIQDRDMTEDPKGQSHYWGYACALSEVISKVEFIKYPVALPADTEEE